MEVVAPEYPLEVKLNFYGYEALVKESLKQRMELADGEVGFTTFTPREGPLDLRHFLQKGQKHQLRPTKSTVTELDPPESGELREH
eukprot:6696505-Karenia_brevis.AAC.1